MEGLDLASRVTTSAPYAWGNPGAPHHLVAYDFGIKRNILRLFDENGCRVTVVPAQTSPDEVLDLAPDGVFLSNGPGDPDAIAYAPDAIRAIADRGVPIFGICLGHQLLGLTYGATTAKMPYGHRGGNHPVREIESGRILITSQNHGFAVQGSEETLRISLTPQAQADLVRMLQTSAFSEKFTLVPNSNAPVLHVSSNIVLQFLENGNVIPFVILKGKLIDAHGAASSWTMRYAASIGGPRPLDGDHGWLSEGGASLKMNVSSALERALLVMLTDISSPFPRDDSRKSAADGYFPFMKKRIQVVGYSIIEDTDWIAFSPKIIGTSLLAGVNIMDKSVTKIRVATKDDRRISVSSERP